MESKILESLNNVLETRKLKLKNNTEEANKIVVDAISYFEDLDVVRLCIILCEDESKIVVDTGIGESTEYPNLVYPKIVFDIINQILESEKELKEELLINYYENNTVIYLKN